MSFAQYLREQAKKNEKPECKFKTFSPYQGSDRQHGNYTISATTILNKWLEENPRVEIIDWKSCAVGAARNFILQFSIRSLKKIK